MSLMSSQIEVESFVISNVSHWLDQKNGGMKVPLTCGCGPLIDWVTMHEFRPSDSDLNLQLQYIEGANQEMQCVQRRSPPLALIVLDTGELHKFDEYLNRMINHSLASFIPECYAAEETFQTGILQLLANLYSNMDDGEDVSS